MPASLRGATVFLTGASSGIGRELARQLSSGGCRLALFARRRERLEELAVELKSAGGVVEVYACDVADRAQVIASFEQACAALGDPDLAVLNAGVGGPTPANRFVAAELEHIFSVNVFGVVYALEFLLPRFLERGAGHLGVVSSIAAYRGLPGSSAYGASKAAVTNLCEGLRIELAQTGVVLTTISPGFVESEMTADHTFKMPFLWPVDRAARRIVGGLRRRQREIHFPWQMSLSFGLARALPNWLWDALVRWIDPRGALKPR
jgi:short-subunit dehydrogenase